jgi:hypothetical protein
MVSRGMESGIGIRTWLAVVGLLLILPPGLPAAFSTDRPLLWGLVAVAFAVIGGSVVWLVSYQACKHGGRSRLDGDSRR